jgi:pimeloyl-ACP methyl ester carboxylesterase
MTHSPSTVTPLPVRVGADGVVLSGDLSIPADARGLVVFSHGSGSSRFSPRNRAVAEVLQQAHFATLLLDLLTPGEERTDEVTAEFRFNIALLGNRVIAAVDWATTHAPTATLPLGLFGASTGVAGALIAAAERPSVVRAVVSRGGRPDLAGDALDRVTAPTLLIVGSRDELVLELNRHALERLRGEKQLVVVPNATHLFEESGALGKVARLAAEWFERYLV